MHTFSTRDVVHAPADVWLCAHAQPCSAAAWFADWALSSSRVDTRSCAGTSYVQPFSTDTHDDFKPQAVAGTPKSIHDAIEEDVKSNDVMLYMKVRSLARTMARYRYRSVSYARARIRARRARVASHANTADTTLIARVTHKHSHALREQHLPHQHRAK